MVRDIERDSQKETERARVVRDIERDSQMETEREWLEI